MSGLPAGWVEMPLGDLLVTASVFTDGDWVETKDQDPRGDVRLTQLADIGVAQWRDRSARFMRMERAEEMGCTFLEPNDVLVARMPEPLGRACIFPGDPRPSVTAVDVCVIRPDPGVASARWLMWFLNSPRARDQVAALQSGTTRKRISRKNLATITLNVPPLAEQERIVAAVDEHLSRLDHGERLLGQASSRLQPLRAVVVAAAANADGESALLGEVADTQLGKMLSRKSMSGREPRPYLRNRNVQWGYLELKDLPTMDFDERERAKFALESGDVIVCEGGEVGRAAIWRDSGLEVYYQKALHRVRVKEGMLPEFLYYILRHYGYTKQFQRFVTGSTIAHLPQEDLRRLPLVIPSLETQRRLVACIEQQLSLLDALGTAIDTSLLRSGQLRRSILECAFAGKLVPPQQSVEPAPTVWAAVGSARPGARAALGRQPA